MTTHPDDFLLDYLAKRDAERADAVQERLATLTERERLLIKEAAVMGYVQGVRNGPYRDKIPGDRAILAEVVQACISFNDLYPTISGYVADGGDEEDEDPS